METQKIQLGLNVSAKALAYQCLPSKLLDKWPAWGIKSAIGNDPCSTILKFLQLVGGGVTGVLWIADIGLFWVRKCRNQSSFLLIADNAYSFAECRYFYKISAIC